jgi:pyridoxine 5'-phosphate synthase PdxJ
MEVVAVLVLALVVIAGLVVAVVAIVHHNQQRAVTRDNQLIQGYPTRAPRSWAVSHEPEARLHRRLRDAMTALHAANAMDSGSTVSLRAELEQTSIQLDDQLVAVSYLAPAQKGELLQSITTTVESIEAAVGRYAAAATMPNTSALEADVASVQRHLDVTKELQRRLAP